MDSSCNKTPSLATDVFGCFDLCLTRGDRSFDLFSKITALNRKFERVGNSAGSPHPRC